MLQGWLKFAVLITIGLNLVARTFYDYCIFAALFTFFSFCRYWAHLAVLEIFYLLFKKADS